jgi:hypothetical protein
MLLHDNDCAAAGGYKALQNVGDSYTCRTRALPADPSAQQPSCSDDVLSARLDFGAMAAQREAGEQAWEMELMAVS